MTRSRPAIAVLVLLTLGGCGSPATKVFDLSPASGNGAMAGAPPSRAGPLIYVDKPTVAAYFDRTQMVTRTGSNRVSVHEFEVWSDPPADLIARALVDDLARRFGKDRVMPTPLIRYTQPDWRVTLDVTRFDVEDRGQAVLDARWTLLREPNDRVAGTRRVQLETPVRDVTDPTQRVQALRVNVATLAQSIADAIVGVGK